MINNYKVRTLLRKAGGAIFLVLFSIAIVTAQTVLVSPTAEGGFEQGAGTFTANGWTVVTGSTNNWYTGTGLTNGAYSFPTASRCAYISNDGGTNWSYASSTNQASHFYRDVIFPAGQTVATLTFKFQQNGNNARLLVHLCDTTATPVAGFPNSGSVAVGTGWGSGNVFLLTNTITQQAAGTVTYKVSLPPSMLGNCTTAQKKRIVFTWNSSTSVANPPVAIDEISLVSSTPVAASAGTFTINNTQPSSGTNFNNFTDAINWLNAVASCGISNPVTINVSAGQTFTENVPMLYASGSAANPIIIQKSGSGANPQIRPDGTGPSYSQNIGTVDYGMCLMGTDYVTIDGIDINPVNGNVEYGYFIGIASPTNGATYNTIKNCSIRLDRTNTASKAILQSTSNGSAFGAGINLYTPTSLAGTNRNNKYLNLNISNTYSGVILYGTNENMADENNTVGSTGDGIFSVIGNEAVPGDIGGGTAATYGIYALYQKNITVHNNKVSNVITTGANTTDGILLGSVTFTYGGISGFDNRVYNNIVTNISNSSTTSTQIISGIRIVHEINLGMVKTRVYNNVINKIRSGYTGTPVGTRVVRGLYLQTATAANTAIYEIVNNTIILDGTGFPGVSNIGFEGTTLEATYVLRNNLFVNKTGAQTGAANHYVLGIAAVSSALGAPGSVSNYNDFYLANSGNGSLGLNGLTTLTSWKANYNTDANSLSADPLLNSDEVLFPLYASPLVGACPALSTPYDKDVLGNQRNATQSTIGAYERTGDVMDPVIADTTLLGVTTTSNRILNDLLYVTDGGSMVASNAGTSPRIYFKKSTDANLFGANNSSANGWKWVEATNFVSPFSFIIDYSLLQSPVAVHDVIQYFFVAQDTVGTPNVAAQPSQGFEGTSVSNITSAPAVVKSYIIYNPPASFVSAAMSQGITAKVITGDVSQQIVRVAVQTGNVGDSGYVSAITFNSAGLNDLNNISRVKVWYTGTNPAFAATSQFGSTWNITAGSGSLGTFTVNGAQVIAPNATSYFWLSYDIRTGALPSDSVDAEVISVKYDGTTQPLGVTTAAGNRIIKSAYCIPVSSTLYEITNVKINTLNNTSSGATGTLYTNYAPAGTATTTLKKGLSYQLSVTSNNSNTGVVVYIDYNDDGVFDDPSERILVTTQGLANTATVIPVTIPCNAVASTAIRMRVRGFYYSNATVGCTTGAPGEVEDYTIGIQDNPAAYVSSSVTQFAGAVAPSATNKVIVKVPVVASGCGVATLDALYCNTNITNNTSNLLSAKLYATGNGKVFNTNKLVATYYAPASGFVFNTLNDTLSLAPGDTNFYWITYDVAPGAATNDTIDIRIDSMQVAGAYYIPANNNPAEYQLVKPVNAYSNSFVSHPVAARIPRIGQANAPVLMVRIVTSNTGGAKQLTSLSLATTGGGNDTMNIARAKVYYTGNSASFNTTTLFGTYEYTNPVTSAWPTYNITGSQYLAYDTNYFWLAYDIKGSAIQNDSVDADLTSFVLDGATVTPTTSSLNGNFKLVPQYCASTYSGLSSPATYLEELLNVTFGTLNNTSTCLQTGGNGSILNIYSDYSELVAAPNISINQPTTFSFTGRAACSGTTASSQTIFKAYIDLNNDGDFTDAGEEVYVSATAAGNLTTPRTVTGTIAIPCSARLGLTRMRVIYAGANAPAPTSCGTAGWYGETEDYTINIVANPVYYVTTKGSQTPALVAPGVTEVSAMRIGVKVGGCGSAPINALYFHRTGTAAAGSIDNAKLYSTGKVGTFTNPVFLGTQATPNGAFGFTSLGITATDNAPADTNYFWLVYDVAASATIGGTLDAVLDSVSVLGTQLVTAPNGDPAGALTVTAKMAFISAQTMHPDLSTVAMGTKNRVVVRVLVKGTTGGAAINVTSLAFSTNGGINDLANIDSARVYYTGKSAVFATSTRFGAAYAGTSNPWGTFTVNGNQSINVDSAYFWLAYDIKATANLFDSVDAEFVSINYDGNVQSPSGGAPAGSIGIKNDYCAAQGFANAFNIFNITNVNTGGINNTTTCAQANRYGNFTTLTAATMQKGGSVNFNLSAVACGMLPIAAGQAAVYIDLDQDGTFAASERVYFNTAFDVAAGISTGLSIPCTAKAGLTRMRVIINAAAITSPCGTATQPGEVEDYTVNIVNNPIAYQMSAAEQTTGTVAQGGVNQQIMRLKVKASGCGIVELNEIHMNTGSTANPGTNLLSAKLYATGTSSVFSTVKLLGTVIVPNGSFVFNIQDTLLPDTNNYWLAYDIASGAVNAAVVDATVDSIKAGGSYYIPSNNNPVAFKTIEAPLFFNSLDFLHTGSDRVARGANAIVARARVVTTGPGAAIRLTAFNLATTGGGIDTANIATARLYYTGNTNVYSTANQFGSYTPQQAATTAGKWMPYTITGNQALLADTNYFWLVYQLKTTAILGDSIDAVLNNITIEGMLQTPTVAAPAGNAIIRNDYCIPGIVSARCIDTVEIGAVRNYSGVNCASPYYTNYPNAGLTRTDVYAGSSLPIRLTFASATKASVFIDLNRNGTFELGEEFNLTGNVNMPMINTSIAIPLNAPLGETRLRIRSFGGQSTGVVTNKACDDWNNSETEDYTITILPALAQATYVWNKSAAADFMVDTNWTPARVAASPGDRLIFGGNASSIAVYNVPAQVVKTIEVANTTTLQLVSPVGNTLTISDSLILGVDALVVTSPNLMIELGISTGIPGVLVKGPNAGLNTKMKRWITGSGTVEFPIVNAKGSKAVSLTYQSAPVPGSLTISYEQAQAGGSGGFPLYESGAGIYVNKVTTEGYWDLVPADGLSGGLYTGTFRADSLSFVYNIQYLVMVNRINPFSNWTLNGNHNFTTGATQQPELSRTGIYGYGQFAVGSDSMMNPLPVSLLHFNGARKAGDVQLNWATASERNNAGFYVERSADGRTFSAVDFVTGAGRSNTVTAYNYTDKNAFTVAGSRILYYRLKQTDLDGSHTYSNTIKLMEENSVIGSVSVYPNPAREQVTVSLSAVSSSLVQLSLYDMSGRLVLNKEVSVKEGENLVTLTETSALQQGVYFLRIGWDGNMITEKIIKH